MKPNDFLTFAESLLANPTTGAASCRTAISRAYYCAFHLVKKFVEEEIGARIRGGGNEHIKLQHMLLNSGVPKANAAGNLLASLHTARKIADYDLVDSTPENPNQARDAIQLARMILSALDEIRGDDGLFAKVKQGTLRYVEMRNRGS